ncbi:shikimate dehydrogenase [Blochmannia endosymbiont of Polyrhachis (Hedomyrma) turneri]|uniref:shikimate dehydrogenase n=1 Tax=Blochmannia endosymbiont of Polyrhachis (Hedomyrma) turneri TaxID=1505596 RepID=UPI00061A7D03|nr:shikimate dehydrogenase [Blochmannia endosymbiont of Polyrhachis (Hedomyrma) turneri]AKC59798.1 shikimate dehydrogenase [Blochmannia endosymbiont of Polyrhachis (Hedomyrma) turneri]
MSAFAVFGNPIRHSRSPEIYSIFAQEFGFFQLYTRILAFRVNFDQVLKDFFNFGGIGANVTMPFKERAFFICDKLTERASIAGSVNVIKKDIHGMLLGDNTDGVGLLGDLHRLQWLSNTPEKRTKILLLGAGGASRGVIFPLLQFGCQIEIINRTLSRAQKIVDFYKHVGDISLAVLKDDDSNDVCEYDLIINATDSSWVYSQHPILPVRYITPLVACYDMSYQTGKNATPFISWCQDHGASYCSDGLGMLVRQAAYSFLFWHGVFPSVISALNKLR